MHYRTISNPAVANPRDIPPHPAKRSMNLGGLPAFNRTIFRRTALAPAIAQALDVQLCDATHAGVAERNSAAHS
jgi:hypothetical protein